MEDSEASRPGVSEGNLSRSHKSKGTVGGREANLREPGTLTLLVLPLRRPSLLFLNKNVVSYI